MLAWPGPSQVRPCVWLAWDGLWPWLQYLKATGHGLVGYYNATSHHLLRMISYHLSSLYPNHSFLLKCNRMNSFFSFLLLYVTCVTLYRPFLDQLLSVVTTTRLRVCPLFHSSYCTYSYCLAYSVSHNRSVHRQ